MAQDVPSRTLLGIQERDFQAANYRDILGGCNNYSVTVAQAAVAAAEEGDSEAALCMDPLVLSLELRVARKKLVRRIALCAQPHPSHSTTLPQPLLIPGLRAPPSLKLSTSPHCMQEYSERQLGAVQADAAAQRERAAAAEAAAAAAQGAQGDGCHAARLQVRQRACATLPYPSLCTHRSGHTGP